MFNLKLWPFQLSLLTSVIKPEAGQEIQAKAGTKERGVEKTASQSHFKAHGETSSEAVKAQHSLLKTSEAMSSVTG